MKRKTYELQAEICKALAHPLRIEIIELLGKKEMCFSDILKKTGGLKSTLSQQLSLMVEKGILQSRKDSRCVYFRLTSAKVEKVCGLMREVLIKNIDHKKKMLMQA
ncbi:MAG: ArsR/SmtB family transcription factor [Bacteroidota bacterium]